jgi:hypothetical protein
MKAPTLDPRQPSYVEVCELIRNRREELLRQSEQPKVGVI